MRCTLRALRDASPALLLHRLAMGRCFIAGLCLIAAQASAATHPRLMADGSEIARAKSWIATYPWYARIFQTNRNVVDRFLAHGPIYVSPIKQTYQYHPYTCPHHDIELLYEEFRPHEHRCPKDTTEIYSGGKYDAAWSGWYNRRLASHLVWMGLLWQTTGDEKYARGGRDILLKFAELYQKYPTENTILGPAHVFFGTLSESFWGVDMAYGYDFLYDYSGFSNADRKKIKEELFYPLATITQQFPESASNRQLWYNNVSAAVGFLFGDRKLIDFAISGTYGFNWQIGSALPPSGFWPEWSGYHFVALRGMIHLAEMARHNGIDLYHREIAGRSMKSMFDAPFTLILPNLEFPRSKDSGGGRITEYATFYEIGYAVYRDPAYLAILHLTNLQRGKQIVGEESGAHETENPITLFNLVPELPGRQADIYPEQSVNLEGTGFAVLRNGHGPERRYLYLDYGIMGGEHGHPDRLQIGYYARGRNWIVDPLNEAYFNPNLQLWYRQSIAHNTVVLDQTTQTWTNGRYRFFGANDGLQAASGLSETEYPGATLMRTLLQVDDYWVDLFDVRAREKRLIDWPLHGFGRLTLEGAELHRQPDDLFGKEPGIPGYDQLREISSGSANGAWSGVFTDADSSHLLVKAIGEPGTELFTMRSPRLGGFYKQMVTDMGPLPMVMSRRRSAATRFAHLIHAYGTTPTVKGFEQVDRNSYRIRREGEEDLLHADLDSLQFWCLRLRQGRPVRFAALNVQDVTIPSGRILTTPLRLRSLLCTWRGDTLVLESPEPLAGAQISAFNAKTVLLNGHPADAHMIGNTVAFPRTRRFDVTTATSDTLFLGLKNSLLVRAAGEHSSSTPRITLPDTWQEHVESQLRWWGGIVNLKATNKGPVTRVVTPKDYARGTSWLTGARASRTGSTGATGSGVTAFTIPLVVPNDAPPVRYAAQVVLAGDTVTRMLTVAPPLSAEIMMLNGMTGSLSITVRNLTPASLTVRSTLALHPAWRTEGALTRSLTIAPHGETRFSLPVRLEGYSTDNQLYPVRLTLSTGSFSTEIVRDLYAGIAHRAAQAPSLDGTWHGWDTTHPITIDKASQVARLLLGNQPWHGVRDLSARVSVMYSDSFLYVGARVKDDSLTTHWNFPVMSYPWDTDCMEVVLDTRTGSDQGADPPTPGLFRHLSMAEHRVTDFPAELWRGGGAGGPLLPAPLLVRGAETFFTREPEGYAMICRYPVGSLRGVKLAPGTKIGFDVLISDNDGTTYRKNQHIWAGFNQNQSWLDLGTMGLLLLR